MEKELVNLLKSALTPAIRDVIKAEFESFTKGLIQPKDDRLYTRAETAKKLNISLVTLHARINDGTIQPSRFGSRILFSSDDIAKALTRIKTI